MLQSSSLRPKHTIHQQQSHPRLLFSTINRLLHLLDPPHPSVPLTCHKFLHCFQEKVIAIHQQLLAPVHQFQDVIPSVGHLPRCSFSSFSSVKSSQVTKWIFQSKAPTCTLDPVQTTLVRACLPALCPLTVYITNCSLESGAGPSKPPQ